MNLLSYRIGQEGEQGFTLLSDLHIGSAFTDMGLLEEVLRKAQQNGDRILINGDIFDMILPQDSKKYQPHVLHSRIRSSSDVMNKLLDWSYELFYPYRGNIDLLGVGNHDVWAEKKHSTDLVMLMAKALGLEKTYGGYCGFLKYSFPRARALTFYYHHGWGGGASAGSAARDISQLLSTVEGVDVLWLGHRHVKMSVHTQRLAMEKGRLIEKDIYFVRTGSFQKGFHDNSGTGHRNGTYAEDRAYAPTAPGQVRMLVYPDGGIEVSL